jgi:hypothetical protein
VSRTYNGPLEAAWLVALNSGMKRRKMRPRHPLYVSFALETARSRPEPLRSKMVSQKASAPTACAVGPLSLAGLSRVTRQLPIFRKRILKRTSQHLTQHPIECRPRHFK